jgi:hypothetical protein
MWKNRSWPNLRYYPGTCLEGLWKTTKNLNQDRQSPGRDLIPRSAECKAGVLSNQRRISIVSFYDRPLCVPNKSVYYRPTVCPKQICVLSALCVLNKSVYYCLTVSSKQICVLSAHYVLNKSVYYCLTVSSKHICVLSAHYVSKNKFVHYRLTVIHKFLCYCPTVCSKTNLRVIGPLCPKQICVLSVYCVPKQICILTAHCVPKIYVYHYLWLN